MGTTVAIVLSNANDKSGNLSEEGKQRVRKAVELFKTGKVDKLLMSGGHAPGSENGPTEAENMREYAIRQGVPPGDILKEEKSRDTVGNAMYCRSVVDSLPGVDSIVVITSDYHVERAGYFFQKAFGSAYPITLQEARIGMSPQEREALQESERKKMVVMRERYGHIADGDYKTFREFVEKTHSLYTKTKSKAA